MGYGLPIAVTRLAVESRSLTDSSPRFLPTMIKGDLDSIRPEVKEYYKARVRIKFSLLTGIDNLQNVPVKYEGDQDSTDLMKCISEVEALEKSTGISVKITSFWESDES